MLVEINKQTETDKQGHRHTKTDRKEDGKKEEGRKNKRADRGRKEVKRN